MDRYTKIKNIGKGNMGACFLMRNNDDMRYYVIKQIDLTKMSKKERQQALNEARVLSSLKHPNIINYVDSFLARPSDHLCIVMEYAEGGDISARIKACRGRNMREPLIIDWFTQICLAVNAIHQKHILHRDIKTQNIFLTAHGIVKVGDFGISRVLQNTFEQAHTFVGTPYYLSPELVQEKPYDARSDIWAIGVVLYEMMSLRHPFNANDMKSLMTRIIRVQYDPPPSFYSSELRAIVAKVLVKDPRHRMQLGEILSSGIIRKRIAQWVEGVESVPKAYVDQMLKHKLLPGFQRAESESGLPSVPLEDSPEEVHKRVQAQQEQDQRVQQQKREEIRREFKDVKMGKQDDLPGLPPARRRSSHDHNFPAQYDALRRNEGYARHGGDHHGARPPNHPVSYEDAQRAREMQKERELMGMMNQQQRVPPPRLPPQLPSRSGMPAAPQKMDYNLPKIATPSPWQQGQQGRMPLPPPIAHAPQHRAPQYERGNGLGNAYMEYRRQMSANRQRNQGTPGVGA
eukprot:Sspe_Gene.70770::Locus_41812_Transcript_1_1_Confidence_1.000_Length_1695::g.70770::m.70770/K08857/NEK1_4_5; NIMA (never in mitosis gene a)-related kinase 1/4/5